MIDLHVHTTASDGESSPSEIIDKALEIGLTHLAITDHDTVKGLDEAFSYVQGKNIKLIPGIELNAYVSFGQMHILGYYIDYHNKYLLEMTQKFEDDRNNRNDKFIKAFNEMGIDITIEEVKKYANGTVVGKPHFAKLLLKKGYINNIEEAFQNFFEQEPLKSIKRSVFTPKDIISCIKNSNGIAILAHPQSLKLSNEDLENKILELKDYGLDGIECYHSKQTFEEMKFFKQIAEKYNMLITLGSDYHRQINAKNIKMGYGSNNNLVDSHPDCDKIIFELENYYKNMN